MAVSSFQRGYGETVRDIVLLGDGRWAFKINEGSFAWDKDAKTVSNLASGVDSGDSIDESIFLPATNWQEQIINFGGPALDPTLTTEEQEVGRFYGGPETTPVITTNGQPDQGTAVTLTGGPAALVPIGLSALVVRGAGSALLPGVLSWLLTWWRLLGSKAMARIPVPPGWAREVIKQITGLAVYEVFIDNDESFEGVQETPIEGGAGGLIVDKQGVQAPYQPGQEVQIGKETYIVASGWAANGVFFYRFRNGKQAVQNKHGVWKIIKRRKALVVYSTGAVDLRTFNKVSRVLAKQSARTAKSMRQQGWEVRRKVNRA